MPRRMQLNIGESGFVQPSQLWLIRGGKPEFTLLFVEPGFVDKSASPNMLRVDCFAYRTSPGEPHYAIHLPAKQYQGMATRTADVAVAKRHRLIEVVAIYSMERGKQPFRTVPDFFFLR